MSCSKHTQQLLVKVKVLVDYLEWWNSDSELGEGVIDRLLGGANSIDVCV